jgi:hypothetical protein
VRVPQRAELAFTGKPGDIWYVFVVLGLCSYAGAVSSVPGLPLILIPLELFLNWVAQRWIVANISSEASQLPLAFTGSVWAYIGWHVLFGLSFVTIIGWAWVATAWMRWMCRNIAGTRRELSFNASGWHVLWRTVVFALCMSLIIPIPWIFRWYAGWYVSQFALDDRRHSAAFAANPVSYVLSGFYAWSGSFLRSRTEPSWATEATSVPSCLKIRPRVRPRPPWALGESWL